MCHTDGCLPLRLGSSEQVFERNGELPVNISAAHVQTIKELGAAADAAGVPPSELIGRVWPRRAALEPEG